VSVLVYGSSKQKEGEVAEFKNKRRRKKMLLKY
jgi:hypothetical protein